MFYIQALKFSAFTYPVPTFNCVFEYQQMASEVLTQPSRYKRVKISLLADAQGHPQLQQVSGLCYTFILIQYTFIVRNSSILNVFV